MNIFRMLKTGPLTAGIAAALLCGTAMVPASARAADDNTRIDNAFTARAQASGDVVPKDRVEAGTGLGAASDVTVGNGLSATVNTGVETRTDNSFGTEAIGSGVNGRNTITGTGTLNGGAALDGTAPAGGSLSGGATATQSSTVSSETDMESDMDENDNGSAGGSAGLGATTGTGIGAQVGGAGVGVGIGAGTSAGARAGSGQ
jgi:hypothetical protein